jgi:hypothetical protein
MYYTVDHGNGYEGAPDLNANTGTLKLPTGQALEQGTGWKTITIHAGKMPEARKQVSQKSVNRPRRQPRLRERGRQT